VSLQDFAAEVAGQMGIPPDLFQAQLQQESSFGADVGSIGNIGQVTPGALADVNAAWGTNYTSQDMADNPEIGIWAAGAYDQLQLNNSGGNLVGMLQGYGTLPQDLSSLSSGQQSVLDTATGNQGACGFFSGNCNLFGFLPKWLQPPQAPGSTTPEAGTPGMQTVTSGLGSLLTFLTSGKSWERIGVIVIGLMLIAVAGFMLATRGIEGTLKRV
jgi:hypothetical protein